MRLVNAHKSELFHIFIDRRRFWCNCLIMMSKRDLGEVCDLWLCPSLSQHNSTGRQRLTHSFFSLLTYICCTDTAFLIAIFQSNFIFRLKSWVLADTAGLKWLHVNCVSRSDLSSKNKGERTWRRVCKGLRHGRQKKRQAKIQAQAVNPEGASLTVDEGGSFVDRCISECVSNKA